MSNTIIGASEILTYDADERLYSAAESVSEDDTVVMKFDNSYDRRFKSVTEHTGTVTHADPAPSDGGTVVLTVRGDERIASLTAKGSVGVRSPGEIQNTTVGQIITED